MPGRIFFNSMAYGDRYSLQKEYQKLANNRWFVKGTDYKALVFHEFGHIVASEYSVDSMLIAKEILGTATNAETLEQVKIKLSRYAADASDGSEIIAECFAAVYGGAPNDFALSFVEACDKIISKER